MATIEVVFEPMTSRILALLALVKTGSCGDPINIAILNMEVFPVAFSSLSLENHSLALSVNNSSDKSHSTELFPVP